jgi:hypothetical protein
MSAEPHDSEVITITLARGARAVPSGRARHLIRVADRERLAGPGGTHSYGSQTPSFMCL